MGSFCQSGPATKMTDSQTKSTYTPNGLQGFEDIWSRVKDAASTPYKPYTGQLVANLNQTQQGGINNIVGATGYLDQARGYADSGASAITEDQINRYMNPFTKNVVNATQANFNESNAQQQNNIIGNAALKGALGGNRVGVTQAETARQQKLAQDPVIANLNQQGYTQAVSNAQADRAAQAGAANQYGNLGNIALAQGQAQIGAGGVAYGVDQAKLNAQYQQYQQALQYPYQQAQFLSQYGSPALSGQGGTQSGTSNSVSKEYAAQPSPLQMGLGLATSAAGIASGFGGLGGLSSLGSMFGTGYTGGGSGGWGANPWSMGSNGMPNVQTAGYNFNRGGSVRPGFKHGGFIDTVLALRESFRHGGRIPGFAYGGSMMNGERVYSADEVSPMDPPYAEFKGRAEDRENAIKGILGEAGDQSQLGKQAVGNVGRARTMRPGYGGDNLTDVFNAPGQFEPFNTQAGRERMERAYADPVQRAAAGEALDAAYSGAPDPTGGATHFYAPREQARLANVDGRAAVPSWARGREGTDIGDHRFFGGIPGPGDGNLNASAVRRGNGSGSGSGAAGYTSPFGGRQPSVGPDDSFSNALLTTGLGILASRAPNALQAVGEGGLLGMKQYTTGKETRQKNEMAADKLIKDAQEFAQNMDLRERTLKETTRYHDILSEDKKTALSRNALPGDGVDAEGKPTKGIYQFNPDTGRYDIFTPGITKGAAGAGGSNGGVSKWRHDAWLALHPEDKQGALDYASGKKQMGSAEVVKAAHAIVDREMKNDPSIKKDERLPQILAQLRGEPAPPAPEKKPQEPGFLERIFGGSKEKKSDLKPLPPTDLDAARKAIAGDPANGKPGKDRNAVIKYLRDQGFDTAGI
jgi:hypothetical protein